MVEDISPLSTKNANSERETSREELLEIAAQFAILVLAGKNVRRVGLCGSLAKGEQFPLHVDSDIDMVILVDDELAYNHEIENNDDRPNDNSERLRKVLGFSQEEFSSVKAFPARCLEGTSAKIDTKVISDNPSFQYVHLLTKHSLDPTYLQNILEDLLIFNSQTRTFEKVPVFSPEEEALIKEVSFQCLKKVSTDDQSLDKIFRSRGHQKRISRQQTKSPK